MKCCSLNITFVLGKHQTCWFWSSWAFSGGVTETQTAALSFHVRMGVTGSKTPSSPKGSSETEMETVLLAVKPKGNKRRTFPRIGIFSSWCEGRQNSFSLVTTRSLYQQYHLVTQRTRQAPKFRMNFRRVGRTSLLLEICNNILLLYDAITLSPMLPGTILTSCPWKSKSLC